MILKLYNRQWMLSEDSTVNEKCAYECVSVLQQNMYVGYAQESSVIKEIYSNLQESARFESWPIVWNR